MLATSDIAQCIRSDCCHRRVEGGVQSFEHKGFVSCFDVVLMCHKPVFETWPEDGFSMRCCSVTYVYTHVHAVYAHTRMHVYVRVVLYIHNGPLPFWVTGHRSIACISFIWWDCLEGLLCCATRHSAFRSLAGTYQCELRQDARCFCAWAQCHAAAAQQVGGYGRGSDWLRAAVLPGLVLRILSSNAAAP